MAIIIGGNSSNVINGTSGHDLVFALGGNDIVNTGAGNDVVYAGTGNDSVNGGDGHDLLFGESGNDTLNGGRGSDYVDGNAGCDTLIFDAAEACGLDIYNGGSGVDQIIFQLTAAQWANAAVKADILAFITHIGCGNTSPFLLCSLNLCIYNIEAFQVKVDGQVIDPFAPGNTVPVAVNDAFSIDENGLLGAGSSVIGNDSTGTGAFTVTLSGGPALGVLTLNANGTFTFNPGTDYDYLAAGTSANAAFTYQITNSAGVSSVATVNITVTGTNDVPTVSGVFTGATVEDVSNAASASGTITVTDADAGQSGVVASVLEGTYGTFELLANGSWTYQLDNSLAATQALAAGVVATETFNVTAIDGTALGAIAISVTGTNDAATASGVFTGATVEDDSNAAIATGTITVSDADTGQSGVVASVQNGTYGTLNLQANGSWVYTLNNGPMELSEFGLPLPSVAPAPGEPGYATQALVAGAVATDTFTITAIDGTVLGSIIVSVTGTNDDATATGAFTGATVEDDENAAIATGTITVSDVDTGQSGVVASVQNGTYGTLNLQANGSWTYQLDNSLAATQALAAGVVATETFNVTAIDGTVLDDIEISVTGANDAATVEWVFDEGSSLPLIEDGTSTLTGRFIVNDVDGGQAGLMRPYQFTAPYADFSVDESGEFTFTFNQESVQELNADYTVTIQFGLLTFDGTPIYFPVYILGVNDAATVEYILDAGSPTAVYEDGPSIITGNAIVSDVDNGDEGFEFESVTQFNGSYGVLTIAEDGVFNYTLDQQRAQSLNGGEVVTDEFILYAHDGTELAPLVIEVNGANDAATASGDFTGAVIEDTGTAITASGTITVNDVDTGQSGVMAGVRQGTYGSFALLADGSWTYSLDNTRTATQALGAGIVATDSFGITAIDGTALGATTISVTGTNDAATATGVFTGAVIENDSNAAIATGTIIVTDVEAGQSGLLASTRSGTYGTLVTQANGAWTYTLSNNPATQGLAAGVVASDTFSVAAIDGTALSPIVISVSGTNDGPSVAVIAQTNLTETTNTNAIAASINVNFADIDVLDIGHTATVVSTGATGVIGGLSLDAAALSGLISVESITKAAGSTTGSAALTFNAASTAFDYLKANETVTLNYAITVDDGDGGTATRNFVVTVKGTNDASTATGILTGDVIEDIGTASTASGVITATDPDFGLSGIVASTRSGTYGTLVTQANGVWTYTLSNNAATQGLAAGVVANDSFTVIALDGTALSPIIISVSGTNDAPIMAAIAQKNLNETTDASAITSTINVSFTDVDLADIGHTATVVSTGATGAVAGLSLDAAALSALITVDQVAKVDGSSAGAVPLTFNAASSAFDYLRANETVTLNYAITVDDGNGGTAVRNFVVTVKGTIDVPTATGIYIGAVIEDTSTASTASGAITVTDADFGQSGIIASTRNGTYGTLVTQANGAWTYTLGNSAATQALAAGVVASDTISVVAIDGTALSPIVISVSGTNDAPNALLNAGAVIQETTNSNPITGTINVNFTDVDRLDIGHTATVASVNVSGTVAGLSLDAAALESLITVASVTKASGANNGVATLDFSALSTQFDYLRAGQFVNLNYNITIDDGDGGQSTRLFTVRVNGTSDEATASGVFTGATTEDTGAATSASGVITVIDPDFGQSGFLASTRNGTYGSLVIQANGAWVYTLNNARAVTQSLTAGVVASETFTLMTFGDTVLSPIVISVSGTNDAPTPLLNADGDANAIVQETTNLSPITGTVNVNFIDVDQFDTGHTATFVSAGNSGKVAGLSLDTAALEALITISSVTKASGASNGVVSLAFSAQSTYFDYLRSGEIVNLGYYITIDDGDGGTNTQLFFVGIIGTNDVPTATGVFTGATIEDTSSAASASGIITVTDVDTVESGVIASTQSGTYGSLALQANGAWVYTLNNTLATTQGLGAGVVGTESFAVTSIDGTALAPIEISVTGKNDSPTVVGDYFGAVSHLNAGFVENGRLSFLVPDRDTGESVIVSDTIVGAWGTFAIESDGDWTYARNGIAFDYLNSNFISEGGLNTFRFLETFTAFTADGTVLSIDLFAAPDSFV